ncbi:MAG TPA: sugar phosphate isomerase/epimerase family protein [Candidatus Hydrogenedentes bacterium]|nr:sugar phosphate isomerase/epimerase family protein [Candidatus Hydrogenedentota bacterium]HPG65674.1 sugar phosphate isomerase/epimerase family protein [Candidatus Hydrogenedentota bacterium]
MKTCLNPVTAWLPEPEAFVALAAKSGFEAVDADADHWTRWVERTSLDYVKHYCAEQGCVIGHGQMPVNFREDEATFEAGLAKLPAMCVVMKALGTRGMATWVRPTAPGDVAEYRKMHVRRLKAVAAVLREHGLMLGLEFVAPKTKQVEGNPFVHDMPGMLELCAEIDAEACGLLLDSYHWYTSHAVVGDILKLEARQIVHVHINDAYPGPIDELLDLKRLLPGNGVIDLVSFLRALRTVGYDGPVSVETFDEELRRIGPEEAARRAGQATLALMKKAFAE